MRASFLPDRPGASTTLTLSFRFSGGPEGIPPPLRRVLVHYPAGLRIRPGGVKVCPQSVLRRKGPSGCPSASLIGRGHALLEVHAGSQAVPEEAELWVFRAPDRNGSQAFEIFGQGETPLYQSAISTGIFETDEPPFGSRTLATVPPIPTVMFEPDASFLSVSLTLGAARRTHSPAGTLVMPRRCPAGGLPFAAAVSFAGASAASTTTTAPCHA
jgi:hypothetical protein